MDWIKKALFLGFVFFIAIYFVKPVGVSTQFSVVSGLVHKAINPDIIWEDSGNDSGYSSSNAYYNRSGGKIAASIENPINYDLIFVLAIPLGAFIGRLIFYRNKSEKTPKDEKIKFSWKNLVPSFLSGFLLLYGARLADGCTSGHMMSGIMQGSVSGYVFAICAFALAIPTAILIGKYREGKVQL